MRAVAKVATVALVALAIALNPHVAVAADCDAAGWLGNCEISNEGTQVDITGTQTQPGTPNANPGGGQPPAPPAPPVAPEEPADCPMNRCNDLYEVIVPPDVTLEDLASFRPAQPALTGQPAGFGVVGMPTNVVATASEQIMAGTILGWDVTVRFVPAGFVFSYGDGTTMRATTGGTTWERLGQAQFTPTPTSHVYAARGTYPVSVSVQYSPSVDFGSGTWRPVAGFVTATSGAYDVRIVEARTALVDRTCLENPRGPGC